MSQLQSIYLKTFEKFADATLPNAETVASDAHNYINSVLLCNLCLPWSRSRLNSDTMVHKPFAASYSCQFTSKISFKLFWRIKPKSLVQFTKTNLYCKVVIFVPQEQSVSETLTLSSLAHVLFRLLSEAERQQIEPLHTAVNHTSASSCRPNGFIGVPKIFRHSMAVLWCLPTVYDKLGVERETRLWFYSMWFFTVSRYPYITKDVIFLAQNK